MDRRLITILKYVAFASCVMCIVYMLSVGGVVTYLLINGVRFSSLSGLKTMFYVTIGVIVFTSIVNIMYIIAKREAEMYTSKRR
ncbi:MAG: hypothetical protein GXO10_01185 [Crenarchaeota archaeon]|nr:hypothetical protein [Thermoproteota archaeon]